MLQARNTEIPGSEAVVRVQEERAPAQAAVVSGPPSNAQTAQERLERVIAFQRFLAESSAILASSLDYETTLRHVARLAALHLADWCSIHVLDDDSRVRRITVAHKDPEKLAWAEAQVDRYPYNPDEPHGLPRVLRTGKSEFSPKVTDEMLAFAAMDDAHLEFMQQTAPASVMIVPMKARGRVLGAITLVSSEPGRPYTTDDLAAAEDLAHGAALAVDNARLYAAAQQELTTRRGIEAELRCSEKRLQVAIRAADHRVLNNLQLLAAMIDTQMMDRPKTLPATEFARLAVQIETLKSVHLVLMRSLQDATPGEDETISARSVLSLLLPKLPGCDRGHFDYYLDEVLLSSRRVTSLGLVTAELCSDVIRHGGGTASVTLTVRGKEVVLDVCDSGPGFPQDFDPERQASTGTAQILSLTHGDLRGMVRFANRPEGGAHITITFPQAELKAED